MKTLKKEYKTSRKNFKKRSLRNIKNTKLKNDSRKKWLNSLYPLKF